MSATEVVFNGERLSRREVEIAREAYATALRERGCVQSSEAYRAAIAAYPLPKVTRPRIVEDPHSGPNSFWRGDGKYGDRPVILHSENRYTHKDGWSMCDWGSVVTSERIKLWADLLANPNETVEE